MRAGGFFFLFRVAMVIVTVGFLAGCSGFRRKVSMKGSTPAPDVYPSTEEMEVGEIAVVRTDPVAFVLIRTRLIASLPEKAELESRSPGDRGAAATLILSPEKRRGFLVADIEKGFPQPGDKVYFRYPAARDREPGSVDFAPDPMDSAPDPPGTEPDPMEAEFDPDPDPADDF